MKRFATSCFVLLAVLAATAQAESFGTGANQFSIVFVPISGSTNPTVAQTTAGDLDGFGIVADDYRMGMLEITNDQWNKFTAGLGVPVTGDPAFAYDLSFHYYGTGTDVPANGVSWYEAAQFVNWLNTSTYHQAAYKFTGTQGDGEGDPTPYTLGVWAEGDAGYDSSNPYRNSNAHYFLPTEDEWVKAAYWNGTTLQEYATKAGDTLFLGDGVSGTGWNYYDSLMGNATDPYGPWDVGSGSEELNGTYDMMGNVWEWTESPWNDPGYAAGSTRSLRGSDCNNSSYSLAASFRSSYSNPTGESLSIGFRVASAPNVVPEPSTFIIWSLLATFALCFGRRRR